VCDRLWQHGGIDASDVDVLVNNGEVTLQGTVDDRGQRRAAEAMAESVWGVQQVQNAIRVKQGLFDRREEYLRDERGRAA
jgi:osmotically-inducible protein OsmY